MDEILLHRIKKGDSEAFRILYDKYAGYALRTATAVTKDRAAAADAVQEAFIRVYRNIRDYELGKPFKPWFYRILVNECRRTFRGASDTVPLDDYPDSFHRTPVEDEYKFEEYEELYKAVERLQDINRVPIILKYLEGFKETEIASILGLNVNTVKSRLFKGRRMLKNLMSDYEDRREVNGGNF